MRIAIVGNFGLTGKQTMATRALPLAEALSARGHAVCLALPARCETDGKEPAEINGVRVMCVGRGPRLPGLTHLWQVLVLAVLCWRWRPEVLYGFKPIAHSGAVLAIFWLLRCLRVYRGTLALDTDDWEGEGGWNDRQRLPAWFKAFLAWQERWSLSHADVVTAASRALVGLAKGAGARIIVYVPNAVAEASPGLQPPRDPDLRARLGVEGRPVVLLYTRFFEFGIERLLDTLDGILGRVSDATLLVVGRGLEGEEESLVRLAIERGIGDRVIYAGWVPARQLPDYFHAADVALYPLDDNLLNRTKCPVKLLDLLAAAVPVVADRVGQAAEYVTDGRTGVLVAPGNPQAMAHAAASLLADPCRRAEMAEAARSDVRARWTWEMWAPEVERALRVAGTGEMNETGCTG